MHDLIQEMGREIVREQSIRNPGRRSRLWDPEEILDVLENDMGTETVEGIMLNVSEIRDISLSSDAFTKMSRLRFLKFFTTYGGDCNVHLPNGLKALSRKLGYFRWDKYPSSNLPSTFCAEKLVELSMANSAVKRLWEGVQNVVSLKKIDLNGCKELAELPDLSRALNLEYVWLKRCKRLHHLHPSILSLYTLVELDLTECTELESLRSDIHFRAVAFFRLSKCTRLQEISVTDELPSSMPHLHKLEKLYLWSGEDDENIPNWSLGQRFLHQFDLSGCNLIKLPNDISFLSSLYELSLSGNRNLESLPTSIKNLSHLKKLDLSYCSRLESLPQLPLSIEILNASYCTSLRTVYSPMPEVGFTREYFALFHFCCFSFVDCMKLCEHAFESIMAYAHIRIKQAMETCSSDTGSSGRAYVYLPKCRLPEWISYRTTKGSLTLPVHLSLKGFILCMILPQHFQYKVNSLCKFYVVASNGKIVDCESRCPGRVASNYCLGHASIWYDPEFNLEIIRAIQTVSALDPCAASSIKVSFQFYAVSAPPEGPELIPAVVEVEESAEGGVYPIYASEYDNFLKERGLEVDFGNKTKRRRDTDDDLELKTTRIRVEGCEYDEQQLLPFTTKKSALQRLGLELALEQGAETNIDELEQSAAGVGIGVSDQQVLHDWTNKLKEFTFQPLLTETFMQQLHEQQLLPFTTEQSTLQHLESGLELEQGTETNIDELEQSAAGVGGSDRENQHEQVSFADFCLACCFNS
ncbi:hypothetical protein L6164_032398 [Bauhinia variegata]|uniref:Uncharacterized protein n=1 Tax=Bauhinia variegata TaxID=167791 RepID=A0ACB9KNK2_BAUVA|nr:hypothetical protein L6164_032398 [Bauhinia variegata]